MTQEYIRYISLEVGGAGLDSLLLNDMHIQFSVTNATAETMKYAEITIWNVSDETARKFLKEFTQVSLTAGYTGSHALIFKGQIARVEAGKENAVDSYVKLLCQDGDSAKIWAVTNKTLAAGWTDDQVYQQLMSDFNAQEEIVAGYKPPFTTTKGARATVLYGPTAQYFNELASRQNCDWFFEDGKLNMLPHGQFLPGTQCILSSASGIIGVPKLTLDGIVTRSLLNPNIVTGGRVQIENWQIAQLVPKQALFGSPDDFIPALQGSATGIGTYVSHSVCHTGDTRGQDWYTDFIGVSIDSPSGKTAPSMYDKPDTI